MAKPEPQAPAPKEVGYLNSGEQDFYKYGWENSVAPELQWPHCLDVFDKMRKTDSQIKAVLKAITLPIRGTTWRIDPNGASDEVTKFVAEQIGLPIIGKEGETKDSRRHDRFSWSEHLRMALLSLSFGAMFFEQVVEMTPDGRWGYRKIAPRMPSSLSAINVARDGGLISIEQKPPSGINQVRASDFNSITIPVNRLVAYSYEREGSNWAGTSILEVAYKNWLIKERLLKVEYQAVERNSMGVPVYENPQGATEKQIEEGRKMGEAYRAGSNSAASLPNGGKLQLLGVSGQLLSPRPVIEYHDAQIGKSALAHFLNLDGQGGSYNLASVQEDLFTKSLSATADYVRDVANDHIVEDLVDWNWGPNEPAPRIVYDDLRSSSLEIATALRTLADAGLIRGDRSLEEWLRRDLGAPTKDTPPPKEPWTPDSESAETVKEESDGDFVPSAPA